MNHHSDFPVGNGGDWETNDVFMRPGDSIELMGKRFIVEASSTDPVGFIISDPDAPGSEQKISSADIKARWRAGRLRFISRDEGSLPIGVRESLRRTMRAFKTDERKEMFRRLRYCQAVDDLGQDFSRSQTGFLPAIERVLATKSDSNPPDWSTLYRWWKIWVTAGRDVRSLCPSVRSRGNRTPRLPEYMQRAIAMGVKHWLALSQPKKRTSYNVVVSECVKFHGGKAAVDRILEADPKATLWPSYRTFCAHCDRRANRAVRLLNRHGPSKTRYEMNPVGEGPEATFPLERVECDFKYLRIFVTDDRTGLPLGTPYLMAGIDCFSGVIVGFDLGFDPPSYASAARCLKHAVQFKDLSIFPNDEDGHPIIRGSYPVSGVPHLFVLDNDAAFHARSFEESAKALGSNIDFLPPAEHWKKGKIERFWGSLQTAYLDMFPGKVLRIGESKQQEYDPAKDAQLTLSQVNLLITKAIVDVHNEGIEPDTDNYRIDLWNEGVAVHPPRMVRDHESLVELVGAYSNRRAERRGIRMFGLRYNSYDLACYRAGFQSDPRVDIRYDPQDISRIWVIDSEKGISFSVPCTRPDYVKGLSEHQHRVIRHHAATRSPKGRLKMKQLVLARAELFDLGKEIIGGRGGSRTKKAIARFLGADRELIDEMNRSFEDEATNGPLDLEIDDPDDESRAHQDEDLVSQLTEGQQRADNSRRQTEAAPRSTEATEPHPADDAANVGRVAGAPSLVHRPAPSDPAIDQENGVPETSPANSPRRRRDRTMKVTHRES